MIKHISRFISKSILLLIGVICFNCAGKISVDSSSDIVPDIILEPSEEVIDSAPGWYTDIPFKEGFRYQVGTAVGKDEETVADHAEYYAFNNLDQELEAEMHVELNHALDQIGKNENSFIGKALRRAGNKIISNHVENYSIVEKEIQAEYSDIGNMYRAYILIKWDSGPAQQDLLDKIKERDKLYNKMVSTDLLEKMEAAVEAYSNRGK